MNPAIDKAIARTAFDGIAGIEPAVLRVLAEGLALAEAPLRELSTPLDCFADVLEFADVDDRLAVLCMTHALRMIATHPDCADLIDRLEALDGPPWPQLHAALDAASHLYAERPERTPTE